MKRNFTRNHLAKRINIKLGYSREEAKEFIDIFLESIIKNINTENKIKISKLGTFLILNKKERLGRNPKTGKEAVISARKVVSCKFSKLFKELIDNSN